MRQLLDMNSSQIQMFIEETEQQIDTFIGCPNDEKGLIDSGQKRFSY